MIILSVICNGVDVNVLKSSQKYCQLKYYVGFLVKRWYVNLSFGNRMHYFGWHMPPYEFCVSLYHHRLYAQLLRALYQSDHSSGVSRKWIWTSAAMAVGKSHYDVSKWKHFPRYWPFVRGIHRSPVNSPHKDQWGGALMFSLVCAWINGWVNNRDAGDLKRHCAPYEPMVMFKFKLSKSYVLLWVAYPVIWILCDILPPWTKRSAFEGISSTRPFLRGIL